MRFALFVHSSQQREERTKKRRRGYRAFGFVTMVAVGVCGTRFARTVLAHFSSVSLATSPPDKGGIGGSSLYSNPLALWALPLYSLTETQGERRVNSITSIAGLFNPSPRRYTPQLSPIFFCATHRNASGHGKGGL